MAKILPFKLNRNAALTGSGNAVVPVGAGLEQEVDLQSAAVLALVRAQASAKELPTFADFAKRLGDQLRAVGRAAATLFLAEAERRVAAECCNGVRCEDRVLRPAPKPRERNLETEFGVVRYARTYLRENREQRRAGFFPLDLTLGLTGDRVCWNVLSVSARLATKLSYADAKATVELFLPVAPSTEVIEHTVLGLGTHTAEWFESRPAPEGDGEVLVIMIDSKGAPTATAQELQRRRGKRRQRSAAPSPRHRGRIRRGHYPKKPRRKKGDKSKNAKMATLVVMYTLRRSNGLLLGPINRWIYASFAPKEHAFAVARREADKRGFGNDRGRVVQLVTDGDPDLTYYAVRYFPKAIHTVDIVHVVEKLWAAGECRFPEGSRDLAKWVARQKKRLLCGHVRQLLDELRGLLASVPATGPGNKGRRERLTAALRYIENRVEQMHYDRLLEQDLEISSGPVEGAVKHVIGKRCDHGGMRWVKERAEALLQLRCIEINGQWDAFIRHVNARLVASARHDANIPRLQATAPAPLPQLPRRGKAA